MTLFQAILEKIKAYDTIIIPASPPLPHVPMQVLPQNGQAEL